MIIKISKIFIVAFVFFISINANSQSSFVLSGVVKDSVSGETLPGVSIYEESTKTGTSTDLNGYYSISLTKGEHFLTFSFIGYINQIKTINLTKNVILDIKLSSSENQLEEVVVSNKKPDKNVTSTEISIKKLNIEQIKRIPIVMGETDIFKTIQMLPGINSVAEGRAGFIVRGGGLDQNLILMDEMPLFYASHQRGLYSVFNAAAVSEITKYKGGIPARFGGRSSAVLDVKMTDGSFENYSGEISLGLITSKFSFEAPKSAITSGQFVAWYQEKELLGSGVIT